MNDKVHLLLIDDEKNYLLVLETLLTEAGYAVTALNDPETALAFLRRVRSRHRHHRHEDAPHLRA